MELNAEELKRWLDAATNKPEDPAELMHWVCGPLRKFFPFSSVFLCLGEHCAGEIKITHWLAEGHERRYLDQLATTFDLERRGSVKWWLASRKPFYIVPFRPPVYATPFEVEEILEFNLLQIAAHGVINVKANTATYFSFAGIPNELSDWHLDALGLLTPVLNQLFLDYAASTEKTNALDMSVLTQRKKEIVRCIVAGLDDKSIARSMAISEKTVRNQLTEIYSQLGLKKRSQLIAMLR